MVCCFMWLSKCPKGHLQGVSCSKSDGNMAKWLRLPKIIVHLLGLQHRKTGKTPCAGCKMSLASHGRCSLLKIPRASSGIFRRLHHPPIGFCIRHKAINKKNKPCPPWQETFPPWQETFPPWQEILVLRSSDVVYNSVLARDTFTTHLYP